MHKAIVVRAILNLFLWGLFIACKDQPVVGSVVGTAVQMDNQEKLIPDEGSQVYLLKMEDTTISYRTICNKMGQFSFSNIPVGNYLVTAISNNSKTSHHSTSEHYIRIREELRQMGYLQQPQRQILTNT